MKRLMLTLVTLAGVWVVPAVAVDPREVLADPVLEHRARDIGKELRCLVCQNQSIDDSDADLARDLRVIVRERLSAGDSDHEVMTYVTDRYGDFVLLKPPLKLGTYALWFGPVFLFAAALAGVLLFYRRSSMSHPEMPPPLTDDERKQVDALVKESFNP